MRQMKIRILLGFLGVIALSFGSCSPKTEGELNKKATYALIKRVVPKYADLFIIEYIPSREREGCV